MWPRGVRGAARSGSRTTRSRGGGPGTARYRSGTTRSRAAAPGTAGSQRAGEECGGGGGTPCCGGAGRGSGALRGHFASRGGEPCGGLADEPAPEEKRSGISLCARQLPRSRLPPSSVIEELFFTPRAALEACLPDDAFTPGRCRVCQVADGSGNTFAELGELRPLPGELVALGVLLRLHGQDSWDLDGVLLLDHIPRNMTGE